MRCSCCGSLRCYTRRHRRRTRHCKSGPSLQRHTRCRRPYRCSRRCRCLDTGAYPWQNTGPGWKSCTRCIRPQAGPMAGMRGDSHRHRSPRQTRMPRTRPRCRSEWHRCSRRSQGIVDSCCCQYRRRVWHRYRSRRSQGTPHSRPRFRRSRTRHVEKVQRLLRCTLSIPSINSLLAIERYESGRHH